MFFNQYVHGWNHHYNGIIQTRLSYIPSQSIFNPTPTPRIRTNLLFFITLDETCLPESFRWMESESAPGFLCLALLRLIHVSVLHFICLQLYYIECVCYNVIIHSPVDDQFCVQFWFLGINFYEYPDIYIYINLCI